MTGASRKEAQLYLIELPTITAGGRPTCAEPHTEPRTFPQSDRAPVDHPLEPANHVYADAAPGRRGRGDKLFACTCAKGAWVGLYFVGAAAVLSLVVLLFVCDFSTTTDFVCLLECSLFRLRYLRKEKGIVRNDSNAHDERD
jgi:hypothetical protein